MCVTHHSYVEALVAVPRHSCCRVSSSNDSKAPDAVHDCRLAPICMGILYHISVDDKHKSLFTFTEAIKIIYGRLMSVCDLRREPELIALAVNLTQNQRCALALCEGPNFDKLMKKAIDTKDDLLFKVIRNCSQVGLSCAFSILPLSLRLLVPTCALQQSSKSCMHCILELVLVRVHELKAWPV
jgi:hypothetical protein